MSNFEVAPNIANFDPQFGASKEVPTTQEQCLATLLDLATVEGHRDNVPVSEFYTSLNARPAPSDLLTQFDVSEVTDESRERNATLYPQGADVVATATVTFDTRLDDSGGLHLIDFVRTVDGLKAYEKKFVYTEDHNRVPRYPAELDEAQVSALTADAADVAKSARQSGPADHAQINAMRR